MSNRHCRPAVRLPALALRGHARSHRYSTSFTCCGVPVGAGVPAKGPVNPAHKKGLLRGLLHVQQINA
ncbi:hypothetical protein EGN69_05515 [Pseudomonas monteilii]|nr:hypothetical protein EGN69_05515 [Pseudomonas monteilii]